MILYYTFDHTTYLKTTFIYLHDLMAFILNLKRNNAGFQVINLIAAAEVIEVVTRLLA